MYKIYINDKPLRLLGPGKHKKGADKNPLVKYDGEARSLLRYIDLLENNPDALESVRIHAKDVETLARDFFSLYKVVEAAGGLVRSSKGKLLVIYRRGHWDLPKGKLDPGERREEAAVREVEEETGARKLDRKMMVGKTYHTYRTRSGKRVLKLTYWYLMDAPNQKLTPQAEEDIELAKWVEPRKFIAEYEPIYRNIREIVDLYLDNG